MSVVQTYCAVCDATPGRCDHAGARYLDPIVYEPAIETTPIVSPAGELLGVTEQRIGWAVPAAERELVAAMQRAREEGRGHYARVAASPAPGQEARPVQQLVVALENWLDLDRALEGKLREAYDSNPLRVTRIVENIVRGCQDRRLSSPAGLLWKRLKEAA